MNIKDKLKSRQVKVVVAFKLKFGCSILLYLFYFIHNNE